MFRLMIVDDEPFVRSALREGIDWQQHGFLAAADCQDGQEALERIGEVKPDIVITDVRMPFMNGIELSQELYRSHPEVLVIIISGYEEFEYAKAAVDYGAFAYLLKPLDTEELLEVLERAKESLKNKRRMQNFLVTDRTIYESVLRGTFQYEKYEEEEDLVQRLEEYYHVVILTASSGGEARNLKELEGKNCFFLKNLSGDSIFLLRSRSQEKLYQEREEFCRRAEEFLKEQKAENYCVAASGAKRGLDEILQACYEAHNAAKLRYLVEDNAIYYADRKYSIRYIDLNMEAQAMLSVILRKNKKEIYQELNRQFDEFSKKRVSIYMVRDFARVIMHQMMNRIKQVDFYEHTGACILKMYEASDFASVKEVLEAFVEECFLHFDKTAELTANAMITMAKEYMNKHFSDPELSLSQVADYVHLNPSYFSAVFSKYCKVTFVNYLTELRMKSAREKLKYTDKKISQIAEEAGYSNFTYFCKNFKKLAGVQPKEYREQYKKRV